MFFIRMTAAANGFRLGEGRRLGQTAGILPGPDDTGALSRVASRASEAADAAEYVGGRRRTTNSEHFQGRQQRRRPVSPGARLPTERAPSLLSNDWPKWKRRVQQADLTAGD